MAHEKGKKSHTRIWFIFPAHLELMKLKLPTENVCFPKDTENKAIKSNTWEAEVTDQRAKRLLYKRGPGFKSPKLK